MRFLDFPLGLKTRISSFNASCTHGFMHSSSCGFLSHYCVFGGPKFHRNKWIICRLKTVDDQIEREFKMCAKTVLDEKYLDFLLKEQKSLFFNVLPLVEVAL